MPTLVEIKNTLSQRLNALSDILGIPHETPLPETGPASQVFAVFDNKQGFSKCWHYLTHKTVIDAVTEFRALAQLLVHAETIVPPLDPQPTPQDQALLTFFQHKSQAMDPQQYLDKLMNTAAPGFTKNLNNLLSDLRLSHPHKKDQQEIIRQFLNKLQWDLQQSKNNKAPIIAAYMNEELPSVKGLSYIKDDTLPDYFKPLLAPVELEGHAPPAALATDAINTRVSCTFTWYLFGFIPITHRSGVENRINEYRQTLSGVLQTQGLVYQRKQALLATRLSHEASLVKSELKSFFDSLIMACKESIKLSQQPIVVPEFRRTDASSHKKLVEENSASLFSMATDLISGYLSTPAKDPVKESTQDPFVLPGNSPSALATPSDSGTSSASWLGWIWGSTKAVAPAPTAPVSTANTPALK
jgi:hypothetical protein